MAKPERIPVKDLTGATRPVLKEQCSIRKLSSNGTAETLLKRLQDNQRASNSLSSFFLQAKPVTNAPSCEPPPSNKRCKLADHNEELDARANSCDCHPQVPSALRERIERLKQATSDPVVIPIFKEIIQCEATKYPVCYHHIMSILGKAQLKTKSLSRSQGIEIVRDLQAMSTAEREELRTNRDTYTQFRKNGRPARSSDALGVFRYFHSNQTTAPFSFDAAFILNAIDPEILVSWRQDGTVNLKEIFTWWWSQKVQGQMTIGEITEIESEVYFYHLRLVNGQPNLGWQRNQIHSIGQQVMRQDLLYYILYACLRPDHQWRLISYPYYCKYATPGDSTAFRHLDLDLSRLANGRGYAMIQGSLSIDDEQADDCTELIPGMHLHAKEWYERQLSRGHAMSFTINRVDSRAFTKDDAAHFGTDWTPVPAKRGTVRISMPHLPHGAKGPCKRIRRTFLPWFVGIQDGHDKLEIEEGGTWGDLREAHFKKTAPPSSPSGLPNKHGAIPYAFPASVDVRGLGPVSDALVGRTMWTDAEVLEERDLLLGLDRAKAQDRIDEWRKTAVLKANKAFHEMVRLEKLAFGEKSYFYRQESGLAGQLPADEDDDLGRDNTILKYFQTGG